jgi:hypothetical protein
MIRFLSKLFQALKALAVAVHNVLPIHVDLYLGWLLLKVPANIELLPTLSLPSSNGINTLLSLSHKAEHIFPFHSTPGRLPTPFHANVRSLDQEGRPIFTFIHFAV